MAGTELLPTSVAAVLRRPEQALFVVDAAEPLDRLVAREASELRLATLPAELTLDELVERGAEQTSVLVGSTR